jgi:general secretion pathway protein H
MTLIEVLVVVTLAVLLMVMVVSGMGALTNARLKSAITLVTSAIRVAYVRASATANPQRVVFDLDNRKLWLEEGTSKMLVVEGDYSMTGGADPATVVEKKAQEQADRIMKGPRIPKPTFRPIRASGIEDDNGSSQRDLGRNVYYREVMIQHQLEPMRKTGRAYLYVWPGGQTELAEIQLAKGDQPTDSDTMTVFVHPLTGKTRIVNGAQRLVIPMTDQEASERDDRGLF